MSIYAKGVAVLLAILALVAFGWREHHQGYVAGQAEVQARWDKQTAAIDTAATAAIQQAASDALANTRAASVAADTAAQHQAEQADFKKAIIKRVSEYAERQTTEGSAAAGAAGASGVCQLDADGLRIWNDANAGRAGGAAAGASDDSGKSAGAVQ
ncbi:hypothetical protein AWB77_06725 [Caballeronia fortuita]|uniref:Bacteriophage protein n=1 Tax=Caballeronia fortuita TaxID=1777138 RepID=A0A158E9U1_9BURK|nr:hypothetical protein [Caballeronia fortuita]SAL03166.1 hypothetical protein AWB77_06725 [Caballeronia fortuita]